VRKTAQHPRATLFWLLSNLVLGYVAAFPMLSAVVFNYYVRAKLWGTISAPYHGAEAQIGAAFTLIGCTLVLTVALLVNRAHRRRLELRGWPSAGFWFVTVAILLTPFLYFWLNELTVPEMFGQNLLW
jgi:hypothetical protein